ncbi:MAG TPA: hypothetical protein PKC28_00760 [Bdellovibrionales bacterium]|nr:hypothetical protein [Bdellovibrionales bacterium]
MEDLTPPLLRALRETRWHLQSGKGVREAVSIYLSRAHDPFADSLRERWIPFQQNPDANVRPFASPLTRGFWDLIRRGCAGQPTLEALRALEDETEAAAAHQLDLHLAALPFKVLIPLLLFQFPAYLLLLLVPLLRELERQMGG